MRLPPYELPRVDWPVRYMERWAVLVEKAARMESATGQSDAFERMLAVLRNMASTGRFDGLAELLKRRLAARALTWLWLNDEVIASRLLNLRLMEALLEAQQPRLTRMTLQQLAQLYFRRFDLLDEREGLRQLLEQSLKEQLQKLPASRFDGERADPLVTLKQNGSWLLGLEGPSRLAEQVRRAGRELGETFAQMGLQGFDDGRYGDVCRAHFYLETLRNLTVGEWDPVMDELLKPSVSKAPYEGNRRIGHAALEVLIDRAGQEPGDAWQNFILNMAGDPRIASSAPNYREWWLPLGEARIQKVRGWLSKEDLRLFLQAVEQYGLETDNQELQRMFPARKLFLEGLFKLKLIRNTRLLLGGRAQLSVKRILGKEVKTSFAKMDGQMNDKAVIYLDCGDFHLVEGSHSFKIWVYLAAPGEALRSYERNTFSHSDLITTIPATYRRLYPSLPYEAIVHTPHTWQSKVFQFLADNGIELDIEQLLSKQDYKLQLAKFGIPVVNPRKATASSAAKQSGFETASIAKEPEVKPESRSTGGLRDQNKAVWDEGKARYNPAPQQSASSGNTASSRQELFSSLQIAVLKKLQTDMSCSVQEIASATAHLGGTEKNVSTMMKTSLAVYVFSQSGFFWSLSKAGYELLARMTTDGGTPSPAVTSAPLNTAETLKGAADLLRHLKPQELSVLRYISRHPGDKVRYAANVLNVEAREINQALYGALKKLCKQDSQFGWHLTDVAKAALEAYDQK